MNEPNRSLDQRIEEIVSWRAAAATPIGLLDQIREELEMDPRQQSGARWVGAGLFRPATLVWVGLLVALLAVAAAGAVVVGSRPDIPPAVAPVASDPSGPAAVASAEPAVVADASAGPVYCTQARSLPFDPSKIDLTGTWSDRDVLYYLRQSGDVLWGVAPFELAGPATIPLTGGVMRALHGSIEPGSTVKLDWAETGATTAADPNAPSRQGSMVLKMQAGADGNTQLVVLSQTGYALTGPAFSPLSLSPCVPSTGP